MNVLRVLTKQQADDTFFVYWTNTILKTTKGVVRVSVPIEYSDRLITAELYALQHLLEVEEVVGENIAGHENTHIIVSKGAIPRLLRKESDKKNLIPYAMFLTTRFKDCPIKADKDERWVQEFEPTITLDASKPLYETIQIHGLGTVLLTSHVVEQFVERSPKSSVTKIGDAWRELMRISLDPRLKEIEKNNPRTKFKYAAKGREEGRYFLHPTKDVLLVVGKNLEGKPTLVTAYQEPNTQTS